MKDSELTPESVMGFGLVLQLLETLKKMKELLEKLIQQPAAVNYITRNYYAPHMENHGPVTYNAPVIDYSSAHASSPRTAQDEKRNVPTFKEMMEVFKIVNKAGYWCSNRSWGVGFQMWQIWGYEGTIQEFVKLVQNCPDARLFRYECNQDAVYKMISKGHLSRHIDHWRADGVLEPYCILGEQINMELMKMFPHKMEADKQE